MSSVFADRDEIDVDIAEWRDSLDYVLATHGSAGVQTLLREIQNHALLRGGRD